MARFGKFRGKFKPPGQPPTTGDGRYKNRITEIDGHRFMSKREANRYVVLKSRSDAGHIHWLTLQPRYPIEINGVLVCTYVADFRYVRDGRLVVEDVKGFRTDIYKIKARLMKAVHGIDVVEV